MKKLNSYKVSANIFFTVSFIFIGIITFLGIKVIDSYNKIYLAKSSEQALFIALKGTNEMITKGISDENYTLAQSEGKVTVHTSWSNDGYTITTTGEVNGIKRSVKTFIPEETILTASIR